MLDRRQILFGAASAAALAPLAPSLAWAAATSEGAKLSALLDAFFQEQLEESPESATQAGLDTGANAALKSRLQDVSEAGRAATRAHTADRIRRLKAINRDALSAAQKIDYDTVLYVDEATQPLQALDLGGFDGFAPSPYVLSPITGAYSVIPTFLDTKHTIKTTADAEAYLARMDAYAAVLDENTDKLRVDVAKGVVPPDFLLAKTIGQLKSQRVSADQSGLVSSVANRAREKGLGDGFGTRAAKLYDDKVGPALDRQIAALEALRPSAVHDAGIGRFRDGPAYYAANLRYTTTTTMTPQEIHQMGLDQAAEIGGRLDGLLKAQGLSQGTVGERIRSLYNDPTQYYANTDAGRAELLAYLQVKLAEVIKRLPTMFDHLPHQQIEARRVPPEIDAGSPLAYAESAPLDRSRPGYIYFNLHDTAEWPKWNLASTLYHEGMPGHQLQGGLAQESTSIPIIRRNMYFSGYGEGWALYAEQLADELGMYDDDPRGRIGYLKAQIFRAGRLVVDTGMHAMGWSREKAIEYMMGLDGDAEGSTTREVERYCAIPAQACSYKIGHTFWNRQRDKARAALGPKFDIKAFHDTGLLSGAMPLDVLSVAVDGFIARVRAG